MGAVMANAFQYLLDILHVPVVENGLIQFDVAEVTLTFFGLPASLTYLTCSRHS